jgi:SAM-dependent methyltransferase
MQDDMRAAAAQYYDANPTIPDDLAFYTARLPSADTAVLELGCGTGRVLLPLAAACGSISGLERSPAMLARGLQKLQAAGMPPTKARVELGDITHFALGRSFDLIIAPYRVFQLLETAAQVEGLFRCVRAHLAPAGTCILNVFHPQGGFERVQQEWERVPEVCVWEATVDGVRLRYDEHRMRLDPATQTLYPELIYSRAVGDTWIEDAVLKIPRRCYTPEAFEGVIRAYGHPPPCPVVWGGRCNPRARRNASPPAPQALPSPRRGEEVAAWGKSTVLGRLSRLWRGVGRRGPPAVRWLGLLLTQDEGHVAQ